MIWILIGFVLGIFVGYWFSKNISYYTAPRLTNFNQTPLNENEEQINIPNVEIGPGSPTELIRGIPQ